MQSSILVITPQASFGELIRQTLEETGRYRVEVSYQAADALARCRRPGGYQLVILDGDLPHSLSPFEERSLPSIDISLEEGLLRDLETSMEPVVPLPMGIAVGPGLDGEPLDRLIGEIRAAQPEARLALIPPEDPQDPRLAEPLPVDGTLSKPFYLPSLVATVDWLISGGEPGADGEAPVGGAPEEAEARQAELSRVMAAAGATGALLILDGEIRAEAGCAGGGWPAGLLAAPGGSRDEPGNPEFILYRRSPDGAGHVLVYAVDRREAGTLALVYPPDLPYSQARSHTYAAIKNQD
jgi:CheY-like chemotaxis protein